VAHVWWVAAAGVVGALGNEAVARYRIRVGRRIGSAALVADGLHAETDSLTSVAVAVGALGVGLGIPLADPLVGLGIAVMIVLVLRQAAAPSAISQHLAKLRLARLVATRRDGTTVHYRVDYVHLRQLVEASPPGVPRSHSPAGARHAS
jgi:hypothetical protein